MRLVSWLACVCKELQNLQMRGTKVDSLARVVVTHYIYVISVVSLTDAKLDRDGYPFTI